MQADLEQQDDHTKLGNHRQHRLAGRHDAEERRTDQNAGEQFPEDRGLPDTHGDPSAEARHRHERGEHQEKRRHSMSIRGWSRREESEYDHTHKVHSPI